MPGPLIALAQSFCNFASNPDIASLSPERDPVDAAFPHSHLILALATIHAVGLPSNPCPRMQVAMLQCCLRMQLASNAANPSRTHRIIKQCELVDCCADREPVSFSRCLVGLMCFAICLLVLISPRQRMGNRIRTLTIT